ncbi:MAG: hypothetical protein ACF8MF_04270 [Phycisphaerales bacterium JB052]
MNEQHNDNTNPLNLQGDPELEGIHSMLDALGQADRSAMSEQSEARVLEAISGVFAPAPIAITQSTPAAPTSAHQPKVWKYRIAAALLLGASATLGLLATQPWASNPMQPSPQAPQSTLSLTSFEQDIDAFLALEEVGDDQLDEAVADWELWAQTIDADVEASFPDMDLFDTTNDGAI